MARFTCPECSARLSISEAAARGKRVRCPDCGARFEPEPDEPRRPRKKPLPSGTNRTVLLIGGIAGGVLVLGLVVVLVVVLLGRGGGGLLGSSRVTAENADSLLEGMTVEEVETILGPGKVCTLEDALRTVVYEAGDPRRQRLVPAGLDDGTTWRVWENGGLTVVANFRKGKAGVERLVSVQRVSHLPGGAVETRSNTGGHADLDAVAAERVKNQQLLKDPRWKTGAAVRTALVGSWRSPKGADARRGWDFNADGTCVHYDGRFGFGEGQLGVESRGNYRFVDDAHVEIVTSNPLQGFPGQQPPDPVTARYKVLVDDKELVLVSNDDRPAPDLEPAMQRRQMPAGGWNKDKIVGRWEVLKGTPFLGRGARLEFTRDGKMTLAGGFPNGQGTRSGAYEVIDETLAIPGAEGDGRSKDAWTIVKLTATELVMRDNFGTVECVKK
jgi:predicted Zn finger-like uncharacterized protein